MATAYQELQEFSRAGFWYGLQGLYMIRGWRPVLIAPLAVPFLGMSRGDVVAAAGASLSLAYLGFLTYMYAVTRIYLTRPTAVIATLVIVTIPEFVTYALIFNTEIFWLFTSFGWLYHILKSDYFRWRLHAATAAAYLGLAVMLRPAETVITTALPVSFFLLGALRHKASSRLELALGLALLVAIGSALILSTFITELSRDILLIYGVVVIAAWLLLVRELRRLNGISLFCVVLSAASLAWWAGFMPALYSWVYTTSFGEMAHLLHYGNSVEGNSANLIDKFATVLWVPFSVYTGVQIEALIGLAVALSAGKLLATQGRATNAPFESSVVSRSMRGLGVVALGMLVPMAALYALSGANDPRRIIVGVAVAVLLAAIVSLRQGPLPRARWAIVLMLVAANLYGMVIAVVPGFPWPGAVAVKSYADFPVPRSVPDADPKLIDALAHLGVRGQSYVAVYTLALFQASARVYEPATLQLAALVRGETWGIGYLWDEGDYLGVLHRLYQMNYRYLLLDLYDGSGARNAHNPYTQFTTTLLDRYADGTGATPELERVQTFQLGGRNHVLFRIMPPAAN